MRTVLDVITDEADGGLSKGPLLDEIELESVGTISATDYIKWVQRSLNLQYNLKIPTDGKISSGYRAAVRRFNLDHTGRDYGDVDEQTQNALIYANEANSAYVRWVILALNAVGLGPPPYTDTYTTAVVDAIEAFQGRIGLKRDGYVGSKTELALIEASGTQPPGEQPEPTVLPDRVFSLDPSLNWSDPGVDELHNLVEECQTIISPVLPGADDRVPVANTRHLPFRWICTIFSIFPAGLGNQRPQMARSSGFLLDNNNLITSAHVLYKYAKHDPGVLRIPDSVVFIPGFDPGETNSMPFGAFRVKRRSATGSARFFVPAEWINSIPSEGRRVGEPKFDYAVIDTSSTRRLSPGEPPDSWTSVSPILASAAAREKSEPEEVGRLILSTRGTGFRTAGYPSDKPCIPMMTDEFEFVGLDLPISAKHNVMLHRADTFFGTSGSPVWLERKVKGSRSGTRRTQKLLIGIVEGAQVVGSATLTTYSTVITPKVFGRLTQHAFLSPV
jgi:V8-like Glu-specific endopeptidase